MAWPTVLTDLRILLSDGPQDKLNYRKKVFGTADGTNTTFKTYEYRRVTNFTTASSPLGIYVNGTAVTVSSDDVVSGEFKLASAPLNTDRIEATYYAQWFLDNDLNSFITYACGWIQSANADAVPIGLQPAVLKYAAGDAYQDLCSKYAMNYSQQYKVEDQPDPNRYSPVQTWMKLAQVYNEQAVSLRDQYYRRSGQALQPLFASLTGAVTDVVPPR